MYVNKIQIGLLKKSFNFLKKSKKKNINISASPLCFLTTWAKNPGNFKINQFLGKSVDYKYLIKNMLSIGKNIDLKLHFNKKFHSKNQYKLIISYSSQNNFNKKGEFYDSYFHLSSKNKKYTWFLISLDNFIPKKIANNIVIFSKEKGASYSFPYFIKTIFCIIFKQNFSLTHIFHNCWYECDFSEKMNNLFINFFKKRKIDKILLNYECIPFQNSLMQSVKKINKKTKVLGYLHCAPWPLQTDLIFRDFSIDTLYVSSRNQKIVLEKYLKWSKKKIKVIPSLRFTKNKKKEFQNFIFFPYNLKQNNNYYERFKNFISENSEIKLSKFKIRIHPLNKTSIPHRNLKLKFEKLLSNYKNKSISLSNSNSIFLGSATGVCVQALEEGTEIIHFPDNETDVFSDKIWTQIKVKLLDKDIYQYSLKSFGRTFWVNSETKKFEKYINF